MPNSYQKLSNESIKETKLEPLTHLPELGVQMSYEHKPVISTSK